MLNPGGGLGAWEAPDGTNDEAPGLKEKLLALGFSPLLGWPLCKRFAGFPGSGAALSSQESPMIDEICIRQGSNSVRPRSHRILCQPVRAVELPSVLMSDNWQINQTFASQHLNYIIIHRPY